MIVQFPTNGSESFTGAGADIATSTGLSRVDATWRLKGLQVRNVCR